MQDQLRASLPGSNLLLTSRDNNHAPIFTVYPAVKGVLVSEPKSGLLTNSDVVLRTTVY